MRSAGLRGATLRRYVVMTVNDAKARPAVDLVERQFYADGPDRLRVADITSIPTWTGFLYLAIVLDVYSRRVVGWAMETHLRTELILAALDMAITQRQPRGVIHHSDRGCQPSTRATPSASDAERPVSCLRWDRLKVRTTTRWPRAFSPRSSESSDAMNEDDEDEKLSTKPGQLQSASIEVKALWQERLGDW
jgi:transposase InsO family protein